MFNIALREYLGEYLAPAKKGTQKYLRMLTKEKNQDNKKESDRNEYFPRIERENSYATFLPIQNSLISQNENAEGKLNFR